MMTRVGGVAKANADATWRRIARATFLFGGWDATGEIALG